MDSKTLWTVVVTAIIVALLTSLIAVKLTGNIINIPKVYPSPTNYTTVYTRAEIDSKLTKLIDSKVVNATIVNYLGGCKTTTYSYINPSSGVINGSSACKGLGNYQCVFGLMLGNYDKIGDYAALDVSGFTDCDYNIKKGSEAIGSLSVNYLCCKK